jgi:hypothetical protein
VKDHWKVLLILDPTRAKTKEQVKNSEFTDWVVHTENLMTEDEFERLYQNRATKGFCVKLKEEKLAIQEMVSV